MNNAQTEAARRARNAAAARARRQDPAVTARQAEAKRARRQANPELRLREAAAKRARRQANPELRRREAEAKRARRQADPTVKDREAEARRKRRQAKLEVRAGDDSATAKRQKQSPLHVGGADARCKRECFNHTFGRSSEVCDRLRFDNNMTITASIRYGRSRANTAAVFPREFPVAVTSPAPRPGCREQRVCAIYDVAVRGVLLKRCPCGQAINTNDASQLLGWKVRKDVSIQCDIQEMAPLPLPREVFSSATPVESIGTGTSCNQAGSLPSEFKNGMKHGTGSAVGCQQLFQCHRCEYSTPKLHRLTCHLQSHSAEKPFRCEVCPAAFKGVHAYKAHMCKHTGEVLYQCHLCPYTTSYRTLLMDHKRAHLNTMSFACNMCAYKTKKKANLHMHKLYHKRDMPFKCKICSFGYNDKRYLKSHMRQHLKS
ncbi:uncharacterized protein LOC119163108 [Rhipicephalus microplus]|uniref:uncharacterized protein LOC119163108 n=1 Tax=Rhipicephalus microplus TaxID=6941 RepID=UPI003F6AD17D